MSIYRNVFNNHVHGYRSVKWSVYPEVYDTFFGPYINKKVKFIEIGVQNGGHIDIMDKYFINAEKVYGIIKRLLKFFINMKN